MKYSFIIPIYNPKRLNLILQSLERIKYPSLNVEYIVIDDGSTNHGENKALIEQTTLEQKSYIYLGEKNEQNRVCIARNTGAKHATGEILIFMDQDTVLHQNYLNTLDLYAGDTIILGGYYGYNNKPKQLTDTLIADFMEQGVIQSRDFQDFRLGDTGLPIEKDSLWRVFCGSHIIIKKNLYMNIGGYDESITRWGDEDVEFGYRCDRHKYDMQFIPSLSVLNISEKLYVPPYRMVEPSHIDDLLGNWITNLRKHRSKDYASYIYDRCLDLYLSQNPPLSFSSQSLQGLNAELKTYGYVLPLE